MVQKSAQLRHNIAPVSEETGLLLSLKRWIVALGLGCFVYFFSCGGVLSQEMPFKLTARENVSAKSISEKALAERKLTPAYFVKAEVLRDKAVEGKETGERRVLVTHYRIEGDLTILTTVDVTKNQAEAVETIPHLPTALSEEEFKLAREMALADPQVKKALAKDIERVTVEPLVLRTMAKNDPIYGHRVVRLLFRVDKNYLSQPEVNVDLTARKVIVEEPKH
jgi:Cu2+-containing amine oxidase